MMRLANTYQVGTAMVLAIVLGMQAFGQNAPSDSSSSPDSVTVRDRNPGSGIMSATIGSSEASQNQFVPSFQFVQSFDSNPQLGVNEGYEAVSSMFLTLQLRRSSSHREFSLSGSGGAVIYSQQSQLSTATGSITATQKLSFRRWTTLFSDSFNYTSGSPFGSPYQTPAIADTYAITGMSSLQPGIAPSQSVLTGATEQLSNTASAQLQYESSRYSSWTASGSYSILNYQQPGYLDSNQLSLRAGYNHDFGPRNSISVFYQEQRFGFDAVGRDYQTHAPQFGYTRRLTGRLVVQASAGPEITTFSSADLTGLLDTQVGWNGSASVRHQGRRTSVGLAFSHGVTGGSGVLAGAVTTSVSADLSRTITRSWTTSLNVNYARNDNLISLADRTFDTVGVSLQVRRAIGETVGIFANYTYQMQDQGACTVALGCVGTFNRNVFGIGFDWHHRPIALR